MAERMSKLKHPANYKFGSYGYIACKDLNTARHLYDAQDWDNCVVHLQQAAEKILKQYINTTYFADDVSTVMKAHKLIRLSAKLTSIYPSIESMRGELAELSDAYFDTRYPSAEYVEYSREDATRFMDCVIRLFEILESGTRDNSSLKKLDLGK